MAKFSIGQPPKNLPKLHIDPPKAFHVPAPVPLNMPIHGAPPAFHVPAHLPSLTPTPAPPPSGILRHISDGALSIGRDIISNPIIKDGIAAGAAEVTVHSAICARTLDLRAKAACYVAIPPTAALAATGMIVVGVFSKALDLITPAPSNSSGVSGGDVIRSDMHYLSLPSIRIGMEVFISSGRDIKSGAPAPVVPVAAAAAAEPIVPIQDQLLVVTKKQLLEYAGFVKRTMSDAVAKVVSYDHNMASIISNGGCRQGSPASDARQREAEEFAVAKVAEGTPIIQGIKATGILSVLFQMLPFLGQHANNKGLHDWGSIEKVHIGLFKCAISTFKGMNEPHFDSPFPGYPAEKIQLLKAEALSDFNIRKAFLEDWRLCYFMNHCHPTEYGDFAYIPVSGEGSEFND